MARPPNHPNWVPAQAKKCVVEIVDIIDDVMACNKPVGMDTIQNGGWRTGLPRLMDVVYEAYPYSRFLNRIDRDTSGIVLFAMTKAMRVHLGDIWLGSGSADSRRKLYLAIIETPPWNELDMPVPLKKDGKLESAHSKFKVLQSWRGLSLVEGELVSHGRTHQLRKHLAMTGSPILNDIKYGGVPHPERKGQYLHSWNSSIKLPSGKWITFQTKIPQDYQDLGFYLNGGTSINTIEVEPLDRDQQLAAWHHYKQPTVPPLSRKEGETYAEYVKRRAEKLKWRQENGYS